MTEQKIPSRTEEDLKQIAKCLWAKQIFCDRDIRKEERDNMIGSIFMPIMLGGLNKEVVKELGLIFEYYDKSAPRSINGYPIFFSCQLLNIEDAKKMFDYAVKIENAMKIAPDVNSTMCIWCEKKYTYTDEEKEKTPWIEKFCQEKCSIEFQAFRNRKKR